MKTPETSCKPIDAGLPLETLPPTALDRFSELSGISPVSLWRYQKRGWLQTYLISNRRYVLAADVAEFNRRLKAGDFAGEPTKPPGRKRADEVES